jgi:UDP-N-acetylglucosamine transferase subunit ALG13
MIYEKQWLEHAIKKYHFDAVISDNRFCFYSKKIPSVYITHQLFIETGNQLTSKIASSIHKWFIKKFSHCWVPDFSENGLAGKLSHLSKNSLPVNYIGALSRFHLLPGIQKKYDLLISISGPEPQRTIFEKEVLQQLKDFKGKTLVIRGLPAQTEEIIQENKNVFIVNHLPSEELNVSIQQAELVICRSGYTSIMDLVKLQKAAILVPTPGQKEQEYLAWFLSQKMIFRSVEQAKFNLNDLMNSSAEFKIPSSVMRQENYKFVINEFVSSLKTGNFAAQK